MDYLRSRLLLILLGLQGYQWHKDKVQSEDGKKQQAKVMDLLPIAHQLGCTVAQLAIGETLPALDPAEALSPPEMLPNRRLVCLWGGPSSSETPLKSACSLFPTSSFFISFSGPAWCLRSEGVSSVLLGVSSAEQLIEHLGALQVRGEGCGGQWGGCVSEPEPISVPCPSTQARPWCPAQNGPVRSPTTVSSLGK